MKKITQEFTSNNPLLVNSINLMLATGSIAVFGFVFWIIVAHSYRASSVGLATTLLTMSGLISLLGLAGFDTVFIRFLPKTRNKSEQINCGLTVAGLASVILSSIFCILIPLISPELSFVDHDIWYVAGFVVFTVFSTWNTLTNSVLIAFRRTSIILYINMLFSILKVCLPFVVPVGGPMTIFLIVGIAQVVNVVLSLGALIKYFNYIPSLVIPVKLIKKSLRFGSAVYLSNIFNLLPDSILPLIVVDRLGANAAAFFYIAFTIANLLYSIAFSTSQALLAEVSLKKNQFARQISNGFKIISAIMIPGIILLVIFSPLILRAFGGNYRNGASELLRVLSISGVAVTAYSLIGVIFKLSRDLKAIIITTGVNAVTILTLSLVFPVKWGLDGIGLSWLIGSFISVSVGFFFVPSNISRLSNEK